MVPILICIALISDAQHRPVMTVPMPGHWSEHDCSIMGRSIIRNLGYPANYTYSSILVDSGLMGTPSNPIPGARVWAPGELPKDSSE